MIVVFGGDLHMPDHAMIPRGHRNTIHGFQLHLEPEATVLLFGLVRDAYHELCAGERACGLSEGGFRWRSVPRVFIDRSPQRCSAEWDLRAGSHRSSTAAQAELLCAGGDKVTK